MKSPALQRMLGEILADVPKPNGGADLEASLVRNRMIQERMSLKALEAAEARWPGFTEMFEAMSAKENEFMAKLGRNGRLVA